MNFDDDSVAQLVEHLPFKVKGFGFKMLKMSDL